MKSLVTQIGLSILMIALLSNCKKDEPCAMENGTYDVSITFEKELNEKLVSIGDSFEIKLYFRTFADEELIRQVQVVVIDEFGNIADTLIDEDVHAAYTYDFEQKYATNDLGNFYIKVSSSRYDGSQAIEEIIPIYSQVAVGSEDFQVKIEVLTPLPEQVFEPSELVTIHFGLRRLKGEGGRYDAWILGPDGRGTTDLVVNGNLSRVNGHTIHQRFKKRGSYLLFIEATEPSSQTNFPLGGRQIVGFYVQ